MTANMTTAAASAATASELVGEVWASVGMEITIFGVTLAVALTMSALTKRQGQGKKVKKIVDEGAPTKANRHMAAAERMGTEGPRQRRPLLAASPASATQMPPRAGLANATSPPGQLIDEVVDGVSQNKGMKFATRALQLYSGLQQRLSAPGGPSMAKAAQSAKHTPLEFYTTVLQCAVRVGRFDLISGIVDDMSHHNIPRSLAFYEIAMKQLAAQKQYSAALGMYDRLAADGLQPSFVTYSCLIGFAAEVGELDRAAEFFEKLSAVTTPSIRAYMTMLRVHAKRQDWTASLTLFREMRERGVRPDSLVLNFVLATGIGADQVEAAAAFLKEVDGRNPPISDVVSYNTLIKGFAQRGDIGHAKEILSQMRARGLKPNSITYNTTMDAAVRGGKCNEAWQVLDDMRAANLKPDKFTCSIMVKGLAKGPPARHMQSALELLWEVRNSCDVMLLSGLHHTVLEACHDELRRSGSKAYEELLAKTFAQMRRCNVQPSAAAQQLACQARAALATGG